MGTGLNPALQAILDSLNEPSSRSSEASSVNQEYNPVIPGLGFLPPATLVTAAPKPALLQPDSENIAPAPAPASIPVPDPSGITTWPAALKHVTKYIAQNAIIASKIRQLVAEQHSHEKQWWALREAITRKHQSRDDNQQQAADLLKSIGGIPTTLRPINEASQEVELKAYDKKVYGELVKMTAAYDRQLRAMGIPFYAIKHELVVLEERQDKVTTKGVLSQGELRVMQRKMLQHLQDLFLEDG